MTIKGNFIDRKKITDLQVADKPEGIWGDGNVFYLSCNDDYTALHIFTKNYYIVHLHWVNFMVM